MTQNTEKDTHHDRPKRKGVWVEIETFEDPESGLAAIITERVRGTPAYSFQITHLDDRGANKFLQVPCAGTVDIEHVVYSLAKRAREYINERMVEVVAKSESSEKVNGDRSKSRRGRDNKQGKDRKKPRGGLSTLAREDAQAGGHSYVGPTRRRREKKQGKKSA